MIAPLKIIFGKQMEKDITMKREKIIKKKCNTYARAKLEMKQNEKKKREKHSLGVIDLCQCVQ